MATTLQIPTLQKEPSFNKERPFVTKSHFRDNFHAHSEFLTPEEQILVSETINLIHKKITDKVPQYDRPAFRNTHKQQQDKGLTKEQRLKELNETYTQLMHQYGIEKLTTAVKESMLSESKQELTPRSRQ